MILKKNLNLTSFKKLDSELDQIKKSDIDFKAINLFFYIIVVCTYITKGGNSVILPGQIRVMWNSSHLRVRVGPFGYRSISSP